MRQTPFTFSYFEYLNRLHKAQVRCPPLSAPGPPHAQARQVAHQVPGGRRGRRRRCVLRRPPYAALPHGLTRLKVANEAAQWEGALETLIGMPAADFDDLRRRCVQHVREEYSNVDLIIDTRRPGGRPSSMPGLARTVTRTGGPSRCTFCTRPLYGGGELQLWRRLRLARQYGIEPVVVIPSVVPQSQDARRIQAEWRGEIELASAPYTCFTAPKERGRVQRDPGNRAVQGLLEQYRPPSSTV